MYSEHFDKGIPQATSGRWFWKDAPVLVWQSAATMGYKKRTNTQILEWKRQSHYLEGSYLKLI